jgi:5-methylcytosine-specific restriction endonuclease McrA
MIGDKRSRLKLGKVEYKKLCLEVMARDKWKCRCCGRRNNLHCHHVRFRSHGGDDIMENLLTLCDECHSKLHERWIEITQSDRLMYRKGEELLIDANRKVKFLFIQNYKPTYERREDGEAA